MPMLLISLEKWFRTRKEDFFEIRLAEGVKAIPPDLIAWIAEKMPHRSIVTLGPSEHSGWIEGGPRMRGLGLDPGYVEVFEACWLGGWDGDPAVPRFQCVWWRYQDWLDRFERIQTGAGLPPEGAPFRWLLCDGGLFWLRGVYVGKAYKSSAGEPCHDDWWIVRQRFPELRIGDDEVCLMGTCRVDDSGARPSMGMATYRQADGDITYDVEILENPDPHVARARKALAMPDDAEVWCGWD